MLGILCASPIASIHSFEAVTSLSLRTFFFAVATNINFTSILRPPSGKSAEYLYSTKNCTPSSDKQWTNGRYSPWYDPFHLHMDCGYFQLMIATYHWLKYKHVHHVRCHTMICNIYSLQCAPIYRGFLKIYCFHHNNAMMLLQWFQQQCYNIFRQCFPLLISYFR